MHPNPTTHIDTKPMKTGFKAIFMRSVLQLVRRPVYWVALFALPLFGMLFFTDMMQIGIPMQVPAAIVDKDGSNLSRQVTQSLGGMQLVNLTEACNSYTEAHNSLKEGKVFGFFMIPENFEQDLLAGRKPVISFYTNMAYFVPATMLFKTFTTTALYTKAGVALEVLETVGGDASQAAPMLMPVNIQSRALHNPGLNYAVYLANSFVPGLFQLMILLVTCFSLGQEIKYGTSRRLLAMADGSIFKALAAKLLPQTIIWLVLVIFMESWLFKWQGYPMHGSWFWITASEVLFVLACQGMGIAFFGIIPNLRMSLSISALLGILCFSIGAYSMPVQSMYGAVSIFSWIFPARYNFLIYIDQALNGIPLYYSRVWFAAYFVFLLAPLPFIPRLKRAMARPIYAP